MEPRKPAVAGARLECLDALRGIAALGVVFWHYQHFGGDPTTYPYFKTWGVSWMYARGWVLVDFFFLLSGIVFTFKYLNSVAGQQISGRDFMILRLSRIFPLYLVTLLMVAAIQWWRMFQHKPTLLYQNNDAYHFVLNFFFLQSGWFEEGYSYNNPAWSVASEMFIYVVFFAAARRYGNRYPMAATGLTLLGLAIYKLNWTYPFAHATTARALLGFFAGSLLYLAIRRINAAGFGKIVGGIAAAALAITAVMANVVGYDAFIGGNGFRIVPSHVLVVFPIVLTLALTLPWLSRALSIRPLTFLGDVSYSVYLLHVPVQMIILSVLEAQGKPAPSSEHGFFWTFIAILAVVAVASHRLFELPAQMRIRKWLLAAK